MKSELPLSRQSFSCSLVEIKIQVVCRVRYSAIILTNSRFRYKP